MREEALYTNYFVEPVGGYKHIAWRPFDNKNVSIMPRFSFGKDVTSVAGHVFFPNEYNGINETWLLLFKEWVDT